MLKFVSLNFYNWTFFCTRIINDSEKIYKLRLIFHKSRSNASLVLAFTDISIRRLLEALPYPPGSRFYFGKLNHRWRWYRGFRVRSLCRAGILERTYFCNIFPINESNSTVFTRSRHRRPNRYHDETVGHVLASEISSERARIMTTTDMQQPDHRRYQPSQVRPAIDALVIFYTFKSYHSLAIYIYIYMQSRIVRN